ncbi:uncharacterized protein LOC133196910 [Saccostrea echinata]|uniref:uncharacterized protein LOC133196910 n=1 Tax=Saccostrea echinata TaxID=191078 RepID=UPI002A7EC442|nr:uncharacterized protein LOC133196910 [Saccostrea echinata]
MTVLSYPFLFLMFNVMYLPTVHSGNIRYFVTDICGQEIGPDFGAYLEFDKDGILATDGKFVPPNLIGKELQCTITVRGAPSTGEKRYMSVYWRNFRFKAPEVDNIEKDPQRCGKAYVTLYKGKGTNVADQETFCGRGALPTHIEWEGEYATLFFYVDYRSPSTPTADGSSNFTYSEIFFRLDITSFDYECTETKEGIVMLCNDSKRCLDDSLRCDFWFSRNCQSESYPRDNSDTSRKMPGNCFKIATTTTTTPPPPVPPTEPDYSALYVVLGLVAIFAFFFWCFWRPGYLIWRMGRLRNHPCVRACGGYQPSPTGAAAWRELQESESEHPTTMAKEDSNSLIASGTSQGYSGKITKQILPCFPRKHEPEKQGGKVRLRQATVCPLQSTPEDQIFSRDNTGQNKRNNEDRSRSKNQGMTEKQKPIISASDINFANDWTKLLTNDGCHLREHR